MGLFDRGETHEIAYYMLRRLPPGGSGWESPDVGGDEIDAERIETELSKDEIKNRAEVDGWPPGRYQLIPKLESAGFGESVWSFQLEPDDDHAEPEEPDEKDVIQELMEENRELRERANQRISEPGEAFGLIFEKALNGDISSDADLDRLEEFLGTWKDHDRGRPQSPDEVAGELYEAHMRHGNVEAATAVLGEWFQADGARGGDDSIISLAMENEDLDVDMETIKGLGMLKFLDNPREMVRETAGGMLEADAQQSGAAGGSGRKPALKDAIGAMEPDDEPRQDTGDVDDVDQDAGADQDEPATAGAEGSGLDTGSDLDFVEPADDGEPDADPAETDVEDVESAPDAEEGIGPAPGEEPADDQATAAEDGGAETLNEKMDEIEDQNDPEAGDFVNAQDAMSDLADVAETDDEQADGEGGEA